MRKPLHYSLSTMDDNRKNLEKALRHRFKTKIKVRILYDVLSNGRKKVKIPMGLEVAVNPPKNDKWVKHDFENPEAVMNMIREHIEAR